MVKKESATMKTILLLAGLAAGILAGCKLDSYCDPGQEYQQFSCVAIPDAAIPMPVPDAPVATGEASSLTCTKYQGFGDTCTDVSQCPCGLNSCNTYMGANYCTVMDCLADPTICPPTGWICVDLSSFGLTSSCAKL
jgi:hypothetical protein